MAVKEVQTASFSPCRGYLKKMIRAIMHVNVNAFFASVEQQCTPSLRSRPIAVIGASRRTAVTGASYQARSTGVTAELTLFEKEPTSGSLTSLTEEVNDRYGASTLIWGTLPVTPPASGVIPCP